MIEKLKSILWAIWEMILKEIINTNWATIFHKLVTAVIFASVLNLFETGKEQKKVSQLFLFVNTILRLTKQKHKQTWQVNRSDQI